MNKKSIVVKIMIVGLMCFTLIGCGSKEKTIKKRNKKPAVELETQVVNGIKMKIPTDMQSFEKKENGDKESTNKNGTASILVSEVSSRSNNVKPTDITEENFDEIGKSYENYKLLDFDNNKKINGVDSLFAKSEGKKNNKTVIMDMYAFCYADQTAQVMIISYSKDKESNVKEYIKTIEKSISVTQKESTALEPNTSEFKLKIDNTSQMEVYDIYCSDTSDWGNGFLNGNVLEPNLTSTITLSFGSSLVKDIKLEAVQGAEVEFYDIDFTGCDKSGATMTITSNETDVLIELNGKTYTGVIV